MLRSDSSEMTEAGDWCSCLLVGPWERQSIQRENRGGQLVLNALCEAGVRGGCEETARGQLSAEPTRKLHRDRVADTHIAPEEPHALDRQLGSP